MKTEIELLREIADEAKNVWDKGLLPLEATHLKNLLTDCIDMNNRHLTNHSSRAAGACDHSIAHDGICAKCFKYVGW